MTPYDINASRAQYEVYSHQLKKLSKKYPNKDFLGYNRNGMHIATFLGQIQNLQMMLVENEIETMNKAEIAEFKAFLELDPDTPKFINKVMKVFKTVAAKSEALPVIDNLISIYTETKNFILEKLQEKLDASPKLSMSHR